VLHCKIPLIFGACVELRFSFSIFDVLHCRAPLIFGPCVELRLWLTMWMCCIAKHLLYLALLLNYFACGELPLLFGTTDVLHCKKTLIFGAYLFWTPSFIPHCSWAALRNTFYIWCFVLNHFFLLPLVMWCYENVLCLELILQYLFYLSLSMCWLVKYLFYFALVLICVIYFALWMCAAIPPKCFTINLCFVYCILCLVLCAVFIRPHYFCCMLEPD